MSPEGQPRGRDPNRMSILEHLEELRSRFLRIAIAVVVGFFIAWAFSKQIYDFIVTPAVNQLPAGARLAYTGIADPFLLYMKVALLGGIFLAAPYVLLQVWLFVSPGLYRKEKRWTIPFVVATTIFFFTGGAFAYVAIIPFAAKYFISLGDEAGFQPIITVKELLSFELQLILATGGVFELPVLIFFLTRIGVVTPAFLWHYFPHSLFVIWLIAAWVTPPDIFSMTLVGLPMTFLYLLGIGVAWLFKPRGAAPREKAAGAPGDKGSAAPAGSTSTPTPPPEVPPGPPEVPPAPPGLAG